MKFDRAALRSSITVADGGWATQLQARGLPRDVMPEAANLSHPELVSALARDYLAAGAKLLTTNTFAANDANLKRRGVDASVQDINRQGAELARAAVGDSAALVAGSIGPSGKILVVNEATPEQLIPLFATQAQALAAGGADVIVLETFSETAEVLVALRAVKDATGLPVVASLSFDSGPQRTQTMMGAQANDVAAALEDAGADAVGCNCGGGIATVLPAVVALRASTTLPLWVKPSAGLPDFEDGRAVYHQPVEEFMSFVPPLLDAGANIIGGCCGTGPEHIRRLAFLVQRRKK